MLKQILSVSDVKKLKMGDHLSDHPDKSLGKIYIIGNISHGFIYAICGDQENMELKVFKEDEVPDMAWWITTH